MPMQFFFLRGGGGGGGGGFGGKQGVVGDAQMANFVSYNEDRGLANIKSVALF